MTTQTASISEIPAPAGTKNRLPLQIGSKVAILQHKHLKCAAHGFVQFINGAYISVRAEDVEPTESDACERTFELYPNELRVVANYQHEQFKVGTVVRIIAIDWLNVSPKTHGIVVGVEAERVLVQPVGAHKGAIISLRPQAMQVESNQNHSPQAVALQTSVLAVLAALGRSASIAQLKNLLSTQARLASSEIDRQLAVLANLGQISLTENQAALAANSVDHGQTQPQVAVPKDRQDGLKAAITQLAKAEADLADAVRQAILNVTL